MDQQYEVGTEIEAGKLGWTFERRHWLGLSV